MRREPTLAHQPTRSRSLRSLSLIRRLRRTSASGPTIEVACPLRVGAAGDPMATQWAQHTSRALSPAIRSISSECASNMLDLFGDELGEMLGWILAGHPVGRVVQFGIGGLQAEEVLEVHALGPLVDR